MENYDTDKLLERLIEDAKKYTSGAEAALDHLNMGFVHLFRHFNGNDRKGLLEDLQDFNSRLKDFLLKEENND